MKDLIEKKKKGLPLTEEEIRYFIKGVTDGSIPDYQISALLMAICFKGMTNEETAWLTEAMMYSGDTIDLTDIEGIKVDKHSTGGVGDKISLIVLPLVASLGIPVAKLSGKGLGHTGGTIDKLEAIPGFSTSLTLERFKENVKEIGVAVAGQTGDLTPADKKLYAIRDVTATVDSIPLIASSIMSKKLASGSDAIVLDVKTGEGAFMKTQEEAARLSRTMVELGRHMGRRTVAVITNMNEPLGHEIGNANEVAEAISILKGERISGLWDVALEIASYMVYLGGASNSKEEAVSKVEEAITSGKALKKFRELIRAQGGDDRIVDDLSLLPQATRRTEIRADRDGFVTDITATSIGNAAVHLGAGREKKEDTLDYSAGIHLDAMVGDRVKEGDLLCTLLHNRDDVSQSMDLAREAYVITDEEFIKKDFILEVIE